MNNAIRTAAALFAAISVCLSCKAETSGPVEVKPGIEVLRDSGFKGLVGKKVGLLTNPSGVDHLFKSTIDILFEAPEVELVALYAPEHGVRGDAYAGASVDNFVDPKTGVPVYSVFGRTRMPSDDMLKGVDVVVYDIQDVGSRSYTFISAMGLMMRACARNGVEFMVLDRPNPVNGRKVEGCYVEPGFYSYVSEFRIPYVYGLTVGELATLINEEGLNCGEKGDLEPVKCKLSVIPMEGWNRDMKFVDTGLPWILPSPNIPYPQSAIDYPSSGLAGEFTGYLNIGVGYTLPFEVFAAEWIDAEKLKEKLESYDIPGTSFRCIHFKPFFGANQGQLLHGVQYCYDDYDAAVLTMTQFYVMQAVHELYGRNPFEESKGRNNMFDKVCGTDYVRRTFGESFKVSDIIDYWSKDVEDFKALSRKYYRY